MTKNRTRTPVYLDPGMHPGLEVKGLSNIFKFPGLKIRISLFFEVYLPQTELPVLDLLLIKYVIHRTGVVHVVVVSGLACCPLTVQHVQVILLDPWSIKVTDGLIGPNTRQLPSSGLLLSQCPIHWPTTDPV